MYYIDSNQWNSQIFEGTNVKHLATITQYYLQHIAGMFKSTKSEEGGQGQIPHPSLATLGHAWVSDGWYWVAKSIKILKKNTCSISAIRDPCVPLRGYRWIWYWSWTSFFRFCWFESPSYMLQIVLAENSRIFTFAPSNICVFHWFEPIWCTVSKYFSTETSKKIS